MAQALQAVRPPARVNPRPASVVMAQPTRVNLASIVMAQVELVRKTARTANQNQSGCLGLARRVSTLSRALPTTAYQSAPVDRDAAAATRRLLRVLSAALYDALVLIQSCHRDPGFFSGYGGGSRRSATMEARINEVGTRVSDCFHALGLLNQARLIRQNEQLLAGVAAAVVAAPPRRTYSLTLTNEQVAAGIAAAIAAAPRHHPRRRTDDGRVNMSHRS